MKRSKQARAHDFTPKERAFILERDYKGCIFCDAKYRMDEVTEYGRGIREIMHYIPRSRGGLGIRQNAAVGCKDHHVMFDNGKYREEMQVIFRDYLSSLYPGWSEQDMVYNKWRFLENAEERD